MVTFKILSAPEELRRGLEVVRCAYPRRFEESHSTMGLKFIQGEDVSPGEVCVRNEGGKWIAVYYNDKSCAFRGLGAILGANQRELKSLNLTEKAAFSMRGLMVDCSRNGVIRPDALKDFLRCSALMGVNMAMLYTEDTYEVPDEPFFGYLRGAYTRDELREIDSFADALGIEMIPCIQALAHLEQVLQWDPYFHLRDLPHVLLVGDERTYEFVARLIESVSACFRSKRIHLGMDEAHGLGTGRYRQIHGDRNPFDIMNEHLARVRDICGRLGLKPMIWSDMYFRLGSKTHEYYDPNWTIPESVVRNIPRDVQLVYWDYYHKEPDFYRTMIANHRKLGSDPIFAGGIWTWSHKWCALPMSFQVIETSMCACKSENLREVFMTMWGDDGMEVDIFSALPGIQYYCEHVFVKKPDMEQTKRRFDAITGSRFADWVKASDIDSVPGSADKGKTRDNTSVVLMWQDPFFAIADPHMRPCEWRGHYERLSKDLMGAAQGGGLGRRLQYPALIARVLALKCGLRKEMETAYRTKNRRKLNRIVRQDLPELQKAIRDLWRQHRAMWFATYKPFGWEVIEHRYGGLMARIETVRDRLRNYLNGQISSIPELDARLLDPWKHVKSRTLNVHYARAKTPSCIK